MINPRIIDGSAHCRIPVHSWRIVRSRSTKVRTVLRSIDMRSRSRSHRPRNCSRSRTTMVHIRKGTPILPRHLFVLRLHGSSCNMMLVHGHLLLCSRPRLDTTGPAVITDPVVHRRIVDHGPVDIGVVHNGSIHIRHRGVVPEMPTIPFTTAISYTTITKPIVHPAIKTNMRPPITTMPAIISTGKTPITRRPQKADSWRRSPITWYPIVTVFISTPCPITRHPEITIGRTGGLNVNRDRRRCNMHGYANTYLCRNL